MDLTEFADTSVFWLVVGFIGSGAYFSRLLVQWWRSERARRPVIPLAYWYLSILGATLLLTYATVRHDPVIMLNYAVPLCIYIRQTVLHIRGRKAAAVNGPTCPRCGAPLAGRAQHSEADD